MRNYRYWLAAALLSVAFPADAGEMITMAVSPRQSIGPTNLTVRVRLEPSAENRALQIVADSGEFYRSSHVQLAGERAERMVVVEFRGVPSGDYQISGVLFNSVGHSRAMARQQAFVLPGLGER